METEVKLMNEFRSETPENRIKRLEQEIIMLRQQLELSERGQCVSFTPFDPRPGAAAADTNVLKLQQDLKTTTLYYREKLESEIAQHQENLAKNREECREECEKELAKNREECREECEKKLAEIRAAHEKEIEALKAENEELRKPPKGQKGKEPSSRRFTPKQYKAE